jgi:hypothetical protein
MTGVGSALNVASIHHGDTVMGERLPRRRRRCRLGKVDVENDVAFR